MHDKSLGAIVLIFGILGAIAYSYWFMAPAREGDPLFFVPTLGVRWALALPVLLGVLVLFFLAIWIGYTMVVTPPPIPRKREDKPQS